MPRGHPSGKKLYRARPRVSAPSRARRIARWVWSRFVSPGEPKTLTAPFYIIMNTCGLLEGSMSFTLVQANEYWTELWFMKNEKIKINEILVAGLVRLSSAHREIKAKIQISLSCWSTKSSLAKRNFANQNEPVWDWFSAYFFSKSFRLSSSVELSQGAPGEGPITMSYWSTTSAYQNEPDSLMRQVFCLFSLHTNISA